MLVGLKGQSAAFSLAGVVWYKNATFFTTFFCILQHFLLCHNNSFFLSLLSTFGLCVSKVVGKNPLLQEHNAFGKLRTFFVANATLSAARLKLQRNQQTMWNHFFLIFVAQIIDTCYLESSHWIMLHITIWRVFAFWASAPKIVDLYIATTTALLSGMHASNMQCLRRKFWFLKLKKRESLVES